MRYLKVTLVQANQIWEDKEANFANYERLLKHVETDLIVLPEMFQTGFSMNTLSLAEDIDSSESLLWLQEFSKKKNAAIYTSLMIKEGEVYRNQGVFIQGDQKVIRYNKRKTFSLANESAFYAAGDQEVIVDYLGWKLQLQICYDLRFPEIVRNRLLQDHSPAFDVILYVANWPMKRARHWDALLNARAIENQCYVVGVNRVGSDEKGLDYSGGSKLVSALGETTTLPQENEGIQTLILNRDELLDVRAKLPFLKDL